MKIWWINKQFFSSQFYCPSKDTRERNFIKISGCCMLWKENCSVDVKRRKLNENFLEEFHYVSRWRENLFKIKMNRFSYFFHLRKFSLLTFSHLLPTNPHHHPFYYNFSMSYTQQRKRHEQVTQWKWNEKDKQKSSQRSMTLWM